MICHGDVQPLNLLMRDGELSGVVDWTHACVADPGLEIGWMSMALLTIPLPGPALLRPLLAWGQRRAARLYIATYAAERPLDPERVRYYQALVASTPISSSNGSS